MREDSDLEAGRLPAAADRKPWRTPRIIVSEVRQTEVGGFVPPDSNNNQSS